VQFAVVEVRQKLADPQFQALVEKYLKGLCKDLGEYENVCRDGVEQYAPLAFVVALQWLQPATVCVDLVHLCPAPPPLQS
jgi:hypothetical protein